MIERRWRILSAFAAVYLIWGSTYLAIRFAIETLPPFLMAGTRFLVAGLVLYGWARWRGEGRPTRRNWMAATLLGGLLLLGGNGVVSWAELRVPSGLAALLISTVPLCVVLLEWIGPRVVRVGRPSRPVLLGVAGGLAGIVLLVGPGELLGEGIDPIGAAALIAASLSWAFGSTLARRLPLPSSPVLGTAQEMVGGGVLLLLAGAALGEPARLDLAAVTSSSVAALAYLIVLGSLVAFTAYVYLLREVPVAKVATYAYVNPLVALLLGWAIAGEQLNARTLVASTIILASVVVITAYRGSGRKAASRAAKAPEITDRAAQPSARESRAAVDSSAPAGAPGTAAASATPCSSRG